MKPRPVRLSRRRLAVGWQENLRCLKPEPEQTPPFRRTLAHVFLAPDSQPAEGGSGPMPAGAECRENLKILKPGDHRTPLFRRTLANVFPPLGSRWLRGVSRSSNRSDLTWVVRPTRAIGVAAVLALSGHRCHHVARLLVHRGEDRKVRELVEAGGIRPDQEEL